MSLQDPKDVTRDTALSRANLLRANLSTADLAGADLRWIWGWSYDQLRKAVSLLGAIMPEGQKYDDWLKDKKTQGKAEKNE